MAVAVEEARGNFDDEYMKYKRRWIICYPTYINSRKTISEGRRLAKNKSVDNPSCTEIHNVLQSQGFNVIIESNKHYPRGWSTDPTSEGRVRIQLKHDSGELVKEEIRNKHDLMLLLGELIPKLKTRQPSHRGGEGAAGMVIGKKTKGKKKK